MTRFFHQLFRSLAAGLLLVIQPSIQDQSISTISDLGQEFVPIDSSLPPLLTFTSEKMLYCYLECNRHTDCRTFDFDGNSRQCRLWGADVTTGSTVISPSKPQSVVGSVQLSPSTYANIQNQSCDACAQSRYETCDVNSNTCQCPSKTFWNGSMCLVQLFLNQTCSQVDACRSDLNLTCQPSCDFTYRCSPLPAIGVGQTAAGFCNGTVGSGVNDLQGPWGIYVSPSDGSLYIADYDLSTFQMFSPFSRMGYVVFSTGTSGGLDVFVDSSGIIYMIAGSNGYGTMYVQQAGMIVRSFPAAGISTPSCPLNGLYGGYGLAVDRSGSIYISLYDCAVVVRWTLNATNGTVVAGQRAVLGSTSDTLSYIRFIHLDEDRGALYVSDTGNNRIQKFIIGGNGTAVTVAGTTSSGTNLNQLNQPGGIWVTRDGQTLYVADYQNHRVMKWMIGASQGSVVGGSASGIAGSTSQLLNSPGDVALDPTETYLYVSDYGNHRVQRFRVK